MLTDTDRAVLDLEGRFWRHAGVKEDAIRTELGLSWVRYYQRLSRLADDPAAVAYAPAVTARVRGRRGSRR